MGRYFIGRKAQLLTGESEEKIRIYEIKLLEPEFGHMPCIQRGKMTFLLMEEGNMTCQVNQEYTELKQGESLFINADSSWRLVESGEKGGSFYVVELSPEYLAAGDDNLLAKYVLPVQQCDGFSCCRFQPSKEEDTDEDILLQAVASAALSAAGRDMAYELDLKSWMLTAWGSLYKKFEQLSPTCKNAVLRERSKLNRMTAYLQEHCGEKLTLAGIAQGCQVSGGDFCRFFKKHMNMTPFEYLQKCRIWNGMDDVLEKSASMTEIASRNGFAGASYFSETFRKEMGCSPADYRKWYQGQMEECPVLPAGSQGKAEEKKKSRKNVPSYLL